MAAYQVKFLPDDVGVTVEEGTSLSEAARLAGIDLASPCGGKGTCGKCAVKAVSGEYRESGEPGGHTLPEELKGRGYVLACRTSVRGNLTVEIPANSRMGKQKVVLSEKRFTEDGPSGRFGFRPVAGKYRLTLSKPTLEDNMNDLDRLKKALEKEYGIAGAEISERCLRELPETVRKGGFEITVTVAAYGGRREIIGLEPGKAGKPAYGAAVDIGTTTVVAAILDMETGKVIDREGSYNRQAAYGSDVITRIVYGDENEGGFKALREAARDTVNGLLETMFERNGISARDTVSMVCGGNTVMTHLFLGVTPKYLRLEPYIPAAVSFPPMKAEALGVNILPEAPVLTIPSVASYVGGDITAGVLAAVPADSEELNLFIDVGTNGELVLGNCEWLVTCSCSAGPAFEGSGVSCGMRAMEGAIDRVGIDRDSLKTGYSVIGGGKPTGVCGSGLISLLSEMLDAGIIDRAGKVRADRETAYIRAGDDPEYVLVLEEGSGTGRDIAIKESDIKNLLRAKAAVFAGIRTMLEQVHLDVSDIAKVYIAGGFGSHINITDAVRIGLLPDLPENKYEYVGNSCIRGAIMGLLSTEALAEMEALAGRMTYLELSIGNKFMDEFVSAMFIPHTDLSLFPDS